MSDWTSHLPVLPVILPLLAGALMLTLGDARRNTRASIAVLSTLAQLAVAAALLAGAAAAAPIAVYQVGNWAAPFGIVLVVDRLAALMLVLSAVLALATLVYSLARWDRSSVHFHPLFQFLLMGLNGAFMTGDLFNLFVFFEILLAASYGLALHGSGLARVKAGLPYVVVNLVASLMFLIGAALIYGVTSTLNLADLAVKAPQLAGDERLLFEAGAAVLGVVFLVKAAAWPLNFWLPGAYGASCAPVAAMFSIMTKVGIYALLRLGSLLGADGGLFPYTGDWLFGIGLLTLLYGTVGVLGAQQMERLIGFCVIVSSGTLMAAIGIGTPGTIAPMLFYLLSSVLATGAFFLLVEMAERSRAFGADLLAVAMEAFGLEDPEDKRHSDDVVGVAIPAAMAFLGLAFVICTLLVAGLPPLSGFVAKFSLLSAALAGAADGTTPLSAWALTVAVLLSGLAGVIALCRMGMRIFWSSARTVPRLRVIEAGPVAGLIGLCVVMAIAAGPVMGYLVDTASALQNPQRYIDAVLTPQNGAR
ncbi:monovalent cation/H+ antiporter subunit D [Microvirgula curvata]|uniref:monovalent cation/H+ antiporter subunit D n=1 Tax=Microvirgula aerodenitrificans TaxID=57480 RepID=UPI002F4257AA